MTQALQGWRGNSLSAPGVGFLMSILVVGIGKPMDRMEAPMSDLEAQVRSIADVIESGLPYSGECRECGEYVDEDNDGVCPECGHEHGIMDGYDYMSDALDIEYIVRADHTYLGARVQVTSGGPNIWIDTRTKTVEGHWWGETARASYSEDAMGIDDALAEMWEMHRHA